MPVAEAPNVGERLERSVETARYSGDEMTSHASERWPARCPTRWACGLAIIDDGLTLPRYLNERFQSLLKRGSYMVHMAEICTRYRAGFHLISLAKMT